MPPASHARPGARAATAPRAGPAAGATRRCRCGAGHGGGPARGAAWQCRWARVTARRHRASRCSVVTRVRASRWRAGPAWPARGDMLAAGPALCGHTGGAPWDASPCAGASRVWSASYPTSLLPAIPIRSAPTIRKRPRSVVKVGRIRYAGSYVPNYLNGRATPRAARSAPAQAGLAPSTRDRLEMVRLSDAGWSVPRIARHLGQHEQTVRAWIKAFLAGGFDALPNKPRGGKVSALTAPMLESVRAEVARGERTWTAAQLADWVAEHHGVRLSADRVRIHLRRAKHLLAAHQPHPAAQTGPDRGRRARGRARRTSQKRGCRRDRSVPSGRSGLRPDACRRPTVGIPQGAAAARALSGAARAAGQRRSAPTSRTARTPAAWTYRSWAVLPKSRAKKPRTTPAGARRRARADASRRSAPSTRSAWWPSSGSSPDARRGARRLAAGASPGDRPGQLLRPHQPDRRSRRSPAWRRPTSSWSTWRGTAPSSRASSRSGTTSSSIRSPSAASSRWPTSNTRSMTPSPTKPSSFSTPMANLRTFNA